MKIEKGPFVAVDSAITYQWVRVDNKEYSLSAVRESGILPWRRRYRVVEINMEAENYPEGNPPSEDGRGDVPVSRTIIDSELYRNGKAALRAAGERIVGQLQFQEYQKKNADNLIFYFDERNI